MLTTIATKCNCSDNTLLNESDNLDEILSIEGYDYYLSISYELKNHQKEIDRFILINSRDIMNNKLNISCKLNYNIFHTEESYLEKYCHESDITI